MARRRARRGNSGKGKNGQLPWIIGAVALLAAVAVFFSKPTGRAAQQEISPFSVTEYREKGGSTFIGNHYTLEGKVENIISRGNDRLVSISLSGSQRERLPLLVKGNMGVNLSRGDSFIFEVDCLTGQDAEGQPVKGVMVVKAVSIK